MKYYTGNVTNTPETIGLLPAPYYWWEAGAMWGAMLDYYHFTGDSTYNNITTQALLSQVGPLYDYMVPAQQKDEGNDDQAFWGFATMSAAEKDYPQPTVGNYSWVELTENIWNTQIRRWDNTSCNGGLKWQIFTFNNGYDYKNSVSNGAFFQLSARLARFTGNQTYVQWAEKSLRWSQEVSLITPDYHVYDGTDDTLNCSSQDHIIWTYNAGIYLYGAAIMYNYTNGSSIWETRTQGFLNATANFFSPYKNATDIMYEPACETVETCDNDQYSFKGYLSRFMWASTLMAPFTASAVTTLLQTTSMAAAQSCSGGADGVTCGEHWYYGGYDGVFGVGQQMSALETLQGLLIEDSVAPLHGNQVHLMAAPVTSTAPVPTRTYSYSTLSSTPSGLMSYGNKTVSGWTSSGFTSQKTQLSSFLHTPSLSYYTSLFLPLSSSADKKTFAVTATASPAPSKKSAVGRSTNPFGWMTVIITGVLVMNIA
jgi:mannan endo-1,6-alpha-mannosidase